MLTTFIAIVIAFAVGYLAAHFQNKSAVSKISAELKKAEESSDAAFDAGFDAGFLSVIKSPLTIASKYREYFPERFEK